MKHQAREDGLGEFGEAVNTGRGGSRGGVNVLQDSGTVSTTFWIGDLGIFSSNGEEGGGHTYGLSEADHREAWAVEVRQDMGYTQFKISVGRGRNTFGDNLHR